MWGIRLFCRSCPEGYGALIQDGGDRSCKDFWVHFSTWDHSKWRVQVLTGICGIRFIVIQISTSINLGHEFKKANT